MYNRLFTKILDSSIWLESDSTRIVWITLLAAMDEDGYAPFSANENLARRANVPIEALEKALNVLESPDRYNPNDEFGGRRIEKVQGGWLVLKAPYYRGLLSREIAREQNRLRVQKHRAKDKDVISEPLHKITNITDPVCNTAEQSIVQKNQISTEFDVFWSDYPKKQSKPDAKKAWIKIKPTDYQSVLDGLNRWKHSTEWKRDNGQFIPHPATFLNKRRWEDAPNSNGADSRIADQMRKLYDEERTG